MAPALSPESVTFSYVLLVHAASEEMRFTHRVTAEGCNVFANPLQTESLILESEVLLLAVSETENVQPVVDGNEDDGLSNFDRICH
jgi:hypothetical protein